MMESCWRVNAQSVVPTGLVGHYLIHGIKHALSVVWGLRLQRMAVRFLGVTHLLLQKSTLLVRPLMLPLWIEAPELQCGRATCITFYKSNHCVFCDPAMEILIAVLDSMGVPQSMVETINVDDPGVEVTEEELPMLPYIKICKHEMTGFISESSIRNSVMNLLMTSCYPDFA